MGKKVYALVFLIIILLYGCKSTGPTSSIADRDYHTGTQGLDISVYEKSAKEVYEKSILQLGVELHNKGAYDIENGFISLDHDDYFELISGDRLTKIKLDGKSIKNPDGQESILIYDLKTDTLESQTETHTSDIRLTACYDYKTIFSEEVCIDSDFYKINPTKRACEVHDITSSSQGAPVAVAKVEVRVLPHEDDDSKIEPTFIVYVANKGDGDIIIDGKANAACTTGLYRWDINVISVTGYLSGDKLECTPNPIRISKDKDNKITCRVSEGISKDFMAYKTNLVLELSYSYMKTISASIDIKKPIRT